MPEVAERPASSSQAVSAITHDLERTRRNVAALGEAIHAAQLTTSPSLARAVQAQQNLYSRIEAEFGLLTSRQAADRMGSRAVARRNAATAAHHQGRLVALRRGRYLLYPGFQFDHSGIRPAMPALIAIARQHEWDQASLIEWLVSPTTYLAGQRPVDILDDPDRLTGLAHEVFGVSW